MFKFFANTETAQAKKIAKAIETAPDAQIKGIAEKATDITVKTLFIREARRRGLTVNL